MTFDTKLDAQTWLSTIRTDLVRGAWLPPDSGTTFGTYSATWLAQRTLKPRTREHYRKLLEAKILPTFGDTPIRRMTPALVRQWHAQLDASTPTRRAHSYSLLKSICATAVADDLLVANPCRIRGAGQSKRAGQTEPASLTELAALVEAMPKRYQLMTLLAAWCGLRFGELTELRAKDIDTRTGTIKIRRAVVWVDGVAVIGSTKSDAGERDVAIPPHLLPAVRAHILATGAGRDGLLFPAATDPCGQPRSTGCSTRPVKLLDVLNCAGMTSGTPELSWRRPRVPRSPS